MQQRSTTEKAPLIRRLARMARRLSQRFGWSRVFGLAVLAGFLALRNLLAHAPEITADYNDMIYI